MGSAWWQCAACLRTQEEDVCELQLNHCNLYDVPPDVFIYERTLEKLFLDANRIKDLPRPLFQCHELRVLSLSDNEVATLPPAIASLINLEYLDLSKNTNFGRLSSLKTLELRENNMMTLPKSMSRLVNLQRLDIGNNDFTELPEVVGDLTNLTELWIDGNDIRRIPTNIEQLARLNHFDCTMNAVHLVPSEIQGWRDISIMNLSSNEIYQLPDSLCYLRTVVTLKIDDNQLNALPDDIGQMSSLEELIVTKNFLEYLPPSIGLLRKLHCLNADNNYLRCLPPEIGSCTALSLLSLRSNNLSRIPPELGHLSSLRVLNLVNNCIKFLPVSMLNLNCLKALWLSDNQSQPLVPLQQEFNCDEDIMVLSCFMLPQKPRQDIEQMEPPVGPLGGTIPGSGRRICFAAGVESEGPRQLHRAPTPYPKELRNLARHARNVHHQNSFDQRNHTETETTIREAIVTKATASLSVVTKFGSSTQRNDKSPHQSPATKNIHNYNNHGDNNTSDVNGSRMYLEECSDEVNTTVLAEEKSPDIREAKCIKNPSSDYSQPRTTVANYVNSTWKPDEYSKANTAKIIESEKFMEPYRSTPINGNKDITNHFGIDAFKVNDVPPLPPPYHIAATFSKKAMLFQQNNSAMIESQVLPFKLSLLSLQKYDPPSSLVSQISQTITKSPVEDEGNCNRLGTENIALIYGNKLPTVDSHSIDGDSKVSVDPDVVDNPEVQIKNVLCSDHMSEDDQTSRPSKIPIFKQKYLENDSLNKFSNSVENGDSYKSLNLISTPTSPITGKKYRVPLCLQSKMSVDRTVKSDDIIALNKKDLDIRGDIEIDLSSERYVVDNIIPNNNFNRESNSVENKSDDLEKNPNLIHTLDDNLPSQCSIKMDNEIISGRSTPASIVSDKTLDNINMSINAKSKIPTLTNSPSPERKPRLKWMFGPHKNANVFPIQVRKNPGLGFSIAGGVAGAETGIIVTKVNPEGPAQGTLRPGDKILEVDGIDFTKMDHDRAVSVLRATNPVVSMMISRHQ
ncbi:protein lap1 isoform X2 [Athalia rosae]|uniref:protein lap1 isoform X2 n=1 Tax=Athalia rosae TaxID=37344 RepID=UPI0020342545|nr:protein lap1 isoform X2 [Athalia rosae]